MKEMLINVSEGEECRIALLEDGRLEELYMERTSSTSHVGNIYKGRVTNVEPSIQAAFIDFGLGRNGFLHISDLMPTYFGQGGEDIQESVGRKMARRDRPPIQRCLRRGDDIVVQIIKEGIGTKGPTLSTYLSVPGRILVMMPGMAKMGVSRKIEDDVERRRLRQILDSLEAPDDVGFIIRTAGIGKTKLEIQRDLTYLARLWQTFVKARDSGPSPMQLYTEGDLVSRTVRDVFTTDIERIVIDNKDVAKRVKDVIKLANPRARNKVELYEETVPLYHKAGIESQIELMHSRHVPLPSGGSLVIDSTEAIVAIDVNSGKFREHSDAEMTAFKTDMEAADEIPRQLRLRDLGGVIICDFIDLRFERHRRELEERLHRNFSDDRAKTRVLRMSQFGIIEITRQRMRPSLKRSIYFDCPHCRGAGLVKTPESMGLDVMRRLAIAVNDQRVARVELSVCPDTALYLQNRKRASLVELEIRHKKRIIIKPDQLLAQDEAKLELFDIREGLVFLSELGMAAQPPPGAPQPQREGRQGRGGRRDDRGRRPEPPRRPDARRDAREDSHSMDRLEQDVDRREEEIDHDGDERSEQSGPSERMQPEEMHSEEMHSEEIRSEEIRSEEMPPEGMQPEEIPQHEMPPQRPPQQSRPPLPLPPQQRPNMQWPAPRPQGVGGGTGGPNQQSGVGFDGEPGGRGRRRRRRGRGRGGRDQAGGAQGPGLDSGDQRFDADFGAPAAPDLVHSDTTGDGAPVGDDRGGEPAGNQGSEQGGERGGEHAIDHANDRHEMPEDNRGNQRDDNRGYDRRDNRGPNRGPNRGRDRIDNRNINRNPNPNPNRIDNRGDNRIDNRNVNRIDNRVDNRRDNRVDNRGDNRVDNRGDNRNFSRDDNRGRDNRDNRDHRNDRNEPQGQEQIVGDRYTNDYDSDYEPLTQPPAPAEAGGRAEVTEVGEVAAVNRPPRPADPVPPVKEEKPEVQVEAPAAEGDESDAATRRRRRGRRGGRGRNRARAAATEAADEPVVVKAKPAPKAKAAAAKPATAASRRRAAQRPRRKPPESGSSAKQPAHKPEPVVRTGSADKHLASDEPVLPPPVSRPRSVRDLDDIPDDFD